jgi:hypothetical protein
VAISHPFLPAAVGIRLAGSPIREVILAPKTPTPNAHAQNHGENEAIDTPKYPRIKRLRMFIAGRIISREKEFSFVLLQEVSPEIAFHGRFWVCEFWVVLFGLGVRKFLGTIKKNNKLP